MTEYVCVSIWLSTNCEHNKHTVLPVVFLEVNRGNRPNCSGFEREVVCYFVKLECQTRNEKSNIVGNKANNNFYN